MGYQGGVDVPERGTACIPQTPLQLDQPCTSSDGRLIFDILSKRKIFTGRESITYSPSSGAGPSFYAKFEGRHAVTVHRGNNDAGPVMGRIDIAKYERTGRTRVSLPVGLESDQLDSGQEMGSSGWIGRTYSIQLPAVAASMRSHSSVFSWRSTSSHDGSWTGGNFVLFEGDGQGGREVAAFVRRTGLGSGDGTMEILVPGLDQNALDQIVVACITMTEMSRRQRQRVIAGTAS